jgi:hypothetical protein
MLTLSLAAASNVSKYYDERRGGPSSPVAAHALSKLSIPKNRSTGNLLHLQNAARLEGERGRMRFSFDAGVPEQDALHR